MSAPGWRGWAMKNGAVLAALDWTVGVAAVGFGCVGYWCLRTCWRDGDGGLSSSGAGLSNVLLTSALASDEEYLVGRLVSHRECLLEPKYGYQAKARNSKPEAKMAKRVQVEKGFRAAKPLAVPKTAKKEPYPMPNAVKARAIEEVSKKEPPWRKVINAAKNMTADKTQRAHMTCSIEKKRVFDVLFWDMCGGVSVAVSVGLGAFSCGPIGGRCGRPRR